MLVTTAHYVNDHHQMMQTLLHIIRSLGPGNPGAMETRFPFVQVSPGIGQAGFEALRNGVNFYRYDCHLVLSTTRGCKLLELEAIETIVQLNEISNKNMKQIATLNETN